jgi:hypothetical protein
VPFSSETREASRAGDASKGRRRREAGAGIAASLIIIAAGAWYFLGVKGPAALATIAPKAIGSQAPTVAVLPFVNERK